ncbi:Uncharacterised protein [Mycobacteroides abscessus subsp. abscessus]|nr:Uncharacterised protein [Mycobacteroides abscessus subsp. abscessus]
MVDAFSPLFDEFCYWAAFSQRFEQLKLCISCKKECHPDPLRFDIFHTKQLEAEHICIKWKSTVKRADSDPNMIHFVNHL